MKFLSAVQGISKADVGLGNVDNITTTIGVLYRITTPTKILSNSVYTVPYQPGFMQIDSALTVDGRLHFLK